MIYCGHCGLEKETTLHVCVTGTLSGTSIKPTRDAVDDLIHGDCKREIARLETELYNECDRTTELESQLQAKDATIKRMKPVVDAAIYWEQTIFDSRSSASHYGLCKAVTAFKASQEGES